MLQSNWMMAALVAVSVPSGALSWTWNSSDTGWLTFILSVSNSLFITLFTSGPGAAPTDEGSGGSTEPLSPADSHLDPCLSGKLLMVSVLSHCSLQPYNDPNLSVPLGSLSHYLNFNVRLDYIYIMYRHARGEHN